MVATEAQLTSDAVPLLDHLRLRSTLWQRLVVGDLLDDLGKRIAEIERILGIAVPIRAERPGADSRLMTFGLF
jgi:hypothetical protein